MEGNSWYTFKCRMPKAALEILESELERVKLLAGIDEDLPDEVQDGLALEMIIADFQGVADESVV